MVFSVYSQIIGIIQAVPKLLQYVALLAGAHLPMQDTIK